jgi:CspA family cold shock protein
VRAWPRQPNLSTERTPKNRTTWHVAIVEHDRKRSMTIGTVKFFNTTKGFGFIAPEGGGKDVFVHATAVEAAGMRSLVEGQRVSFDIQPDARGAKATNLKAV